MNLDWFKSNDKLLSQRLKKQNLIDLIFQENNFEFS